MSHSPPKYALQFLRWFCRKDFLEEIEGDLLEMYEKQQAHSPRRAKWEFAIRVLFHLHPMYIRSLTTFFPNNPTTMLHHYLKISWRNLLKNKGYSLIHISGLGVGMAVALLIGLWIHYETHIDSFHPNIDHIGIIRKHTRFNETKDTQLEVPLPLYEVLSKDYPEVKHITRFKSSTVSLGVNERRVREIGQYVDPDFLQMFSFPLIQGNLTTALNDPKSIILTESLAKILFGDEDPMGKLVNINNEYDAQVTGVMQDVPKNSFFSYLSFLAPFEYALSNSYLQRYQTNWGSNVIWTLLEVNEGTSMDALSDKISLINQRNDPDLQGARAEYPTF